MRGLSYISVFVVTMASCQDLREFIRERLTAAAEEIFSEFEKQIIQYQENIRLMNAYWKPQLKLHRLSLPQQHVSMEEEEEEEEVSARQLTTDSGTSCSRDPEEPRPPQVKHEEEDCCSTREEEEAEQKEETHRHTLNACYEAADLPRQRLCVEEDAPTEQLLCDQDSTCPGVVDEPDSPQIKEEQEKFWSCQEEQKLEMQEETNVFLPTLSCEERESSVSERCAGFPGTSAGDRVQPLAMFVPKEESYEGSEGAHADDINTPEVSGSTVDAGTQYFGCGFCEKTFLFRSRLIQHMSTHMRKNKLRCSFGKKSFSQNCQLINHKTTDSSGGKPLGPHASFSTGAETERLLCNTCGKRFSNPYILKRHARVHTGEKPFACAACGKSFSRRDHLFGHMKSHMAQPQVPPQPAFEQRAVRAAKKLYSCQTCGKCFTRHRCFLRHAKSHSPLVCKTCGKQFRQSSGLKRHESIHSGVKGFPCSVCGKSLSRRDHLVRHMKIHGKSNPFCLT